MGSRLPSPHVVANLLGSVLEHCSAPRAALRRPPVRALVGRQAPWRRTSALLGRGWSLVRLRGVATPAPQQPIVKNAIVETLASRRVASEVDADWPDVVFVVRRAGNPGARRTGNRHRHRRRGAASPRRARGRRACAAAREDGGAADHIVALGRADRFPSSIPWLAAPRLQSRPPASRPAPPFVAPRNLPLCHLAAFKDLPREAPDLFPGTVPQIVALDADAETIPAMVGNLRAAGLTGAPYEDSIVIGQHDVRGADARRNRAHAARRARHEAGRLLLQPAVWSAHRRGAR